MIISILRWSLLFISFFLTALATTTTFIAPVWVQWQLRTSLVVLYGEFGHWLALLPLIVAIAATAIWLARRNQPKLPAVTIAFCAIALVLALKPTMQAWRLSRALSARLDAAFGPASPDRAPFSLAALYSFAPAQVPVEKMEYSDANSLKLDFYRAVGRAPSPCIIDIHGGAWCGGNRSETAAVRSSNRWLALHGYAVASIDYRLAPAVIWPAQRDDILEAIAFLRSHAADLGIDPIRLILLGRSAGGQLAESVAYAAHDSGIRGVIAIYAPADMILGWNMTADNDSFPQHQYLRQFLGGTPTDNRAVYDSSSATFLAAPGLPPTLLIHGQLDTLVSCKQSEVLDQRLGAAGVPHLFVSLPWAAHAFDYFSFNGPGAQITTFSIDWFLCAVTR